VRYARACSAEVRVERSSSIGLGMVQKLSSDPNSAPRSGKTDNRARQRLPEDKSPSVDQLASLRFAVESRGRVCLLVVESTTRRFYWRGPNGRFPNSFWVFNVRIPPIASARLETFPSTRTLGAGNRTFFIGPVSFRLWLCVVVTPTHNVTHPSRIGTGHSILSEIFRQS